MTVGQAFTYPQVLPAPMRFAPVRMAHRSSLTLPDSLPGVWYCSPVDHPPTRLLVGGNAQALQVRDTWSVLANCWKRVASPSFTRQTCTNWVFCARPVALNVPR